MRQRIVHYLDQLANEIPIPKPSKSASEFSEAYREWSARVLSTLGSRWFGREAWNEFERALNKEGVIGQHWLDLIWAVKKKGLLAPTYNLNIRKKQKERVIELWKEHAQHPITTPESEARAAWAREAQNAIVGEEGSLRLDEYLTGINDILIKEGMPRTWRSVLFRRMVLTKRIVIP